MSGSDTGMTWEDDCGGVSWDRELARLGGHPLQSYLWGDARRKVDGIVDHRWLVRAQDEVVWMARFEERRIPGVGRVAWVPKGPTRGSLPNDSHILEQFGRRLRQAGFIMVVLDRWEAALASGADAVQRPQTIWIDLTVGVEGLWKGLDSKVRSSIGKAGREKLECAISVCDEDLEWFANLCLEIGKTKGFQVPGSVELMRRLLAGASQGGCQAHLFLARGDGYRAGGALVLRIGRSVHYMWGASDRAHSRTQAGEALQWAILQWGASQGCVRYDLEGIDPVKNPGVFKFKKKLGGTVVLLDGLRYRPLGWRGALLDLGRRALGR